MRSPHPDATDEDEEEIDPAIFRTTLINAATDETLARGIWDIIAAAQSSRRLRNLRIVPFGFDLYTPDEIDYLIFLARSFLVSRLESRILSLRRLGAWLGWSGRKIRMVPVDLVCCRGVVMRSLRSFGLILLGGMIGLVGGRAFLWRLGMVEI
jgi:hypothetical protein